MWPSMQGDWFKQVNRFAANTPGLHVPMRLYAQYGVVVFAGILLLGWWWARRDSTRTRWRPPCGHRWACSSLLA